MNTCSCQIQQKWDSEISEGSSSPSTCVLCSEDRSVISQEFQGKFTKDSHRKSQSSCDRNKLDTTITKSIDSRKTNCSRFDTNTDISRSEYSYISETIKREQLDVASKKDYSMSKKSDMSCVTKSSFFDNKEEASAEINNLIQLRNVDYMEVVDEKLKIVIALSGYPKSKMKLQQIEKFQRSIKDILDMQLHERLLKKIPIFLDYYLNKGAIVCVCKDTDTRDWLIRISAGLQDRMKCNLIYLKTKVKRLCLAVTKIPRTCWPASAEDTFKLLQYFNPNLKTHLWKIYSRKIIDNVEYTSFIIDNISGEIIRSSTFKNVIDYSQMVFELSGFTEIYYERFLSDVDEDLSSVASRVKLLQELRSNETTPRMLFKNDKSSQDIGSKKTNEFIVGDETEYDKENVDEEIPNIEINKEDGRIDHMKDEISLICKKEKCINYNETVIWTEDSDNDNKIREQEKHELEDTEYCDPSTSAIAVSDITESLLESSENIVIDRNSNLNIDSNRGIAYHRRTNYLHVENELKIAIVLEDYPQNKLEGSHIRRIKHLFKEYVHKDMKMQRFSNLIIPKFLDTYLSNGAIIYICDSLETKDYLMEVLPKLIKSTGLTLTFRDLKDLLRYTRIIIRLPKDIAHVESYEVLIKLKESYPNLKPDCWKYYSDVAGKQKRQFGVDPESLKVIRSPNFDFTFEGSKIDFKIIDRQRRDIHFEACIPSEDKQNVDTDMKKIHEKILKDMYCIIDPDILNAPLTKIRTNHYSDLLADDLKFYIGPCNYPEVRITEVSFYSIKITLENIVFDNWNKNNNSFHPKLYDMYLFDGVIFVICKDFASKDWMIDHVNTINEKLKMNLKSTEFRGAVGIVNMTVNTNKSTEEVIEVLQKQNPRLRTNYWRKISAVQTSVTLDVVLQIDKLSAQIITNKNFDGKIGDSIVQFKLGHLKSLLNSKFKLETLKRTPKKQCSEILHVLKARDSNIMHDFEAVSQSQNAFNQNKGNDSPNIVKEPSKLKTDENKSYFYRDMEKTPQCDININTEITKEQDHCRVILKVPVNILPDTKDGLDMIFDLLEDKNPGLNTELWTVNGRSQTNKGKFNLLIDKQSMSVIKGKNFDATLGGQKLKFIF